MSNEDGTDDSDDTFFEMMELTMTGRAALATGHPTRAIAMLRRKHDLVVKEWGDESVFAATSGVDLGEALLQCGEYDDARRILAWSLSRYRTLEIDDERLLRATSAAAMAAYQASDYAVAEAQYRTLLAELEARGPECRQQRAQSLDHLAQVYMRQNRNSEAEPLLLEALAIFQNQGNPDNLAVCLSMLGRAYFGTYRFREAEAAYRKALEIREQAKGPDSVDVAKELDHIAMSLAMRAQSENRKDLASEAVTLGERAVRLFGQGLPASHPSVHFSRQNLQRYRKLSALIGKMYPSGQQPVEQGSHAIQLSATHPWRVITLLEAAMERASRHDYGSARQMVDDAESTAIRALGPSNGFIEQVRERRLEILRRQCSFLLGEPTGLLSPSEHFTMQMRAHARRGLAEDGRHAMISLGAAEQAQVTDCIVEALAQIELLVESATVGPPGQRKARPANLWVTDTHTGDALEVLHYARLLGVLSDAQACDRAALIMQLHSASSVAAAVAASDDDTDELASLELRHSVLIEKLVRSAMGKTPEPGSPMSKETEELTKLAARIGELRRQRGDHGPPRGALDLVSLESLQANLRDAEAALVYLASPRAVFIVVARAAQHAFVRVEFEGGLLAEICKSVRESAQLDDSGAPAGYDAARAGWLYDLAIWPIEHYLQDVRHVFVCPEGALWTIAFEALCDPIAVRSDEPIDPSDPYDPEGAVGRQRRAMRLNTLGEIADEALRDAWFGGRFTLSILPFLGLLAERAAARHSATPGRRFLGIGNPKLPIDGATGWPPLPESELLLDRLAKFFDADPEHDVIVRGDACVSRIRALDQSGELANRRIICFATHAVYPERSGDTLQQAGLVLSGSNAAEVLTELDIVQLRLDADLVLLTACYTGSPSGKSFTTPLSGLAEAFFRAGARSLLVSSWPVDVHATELLIREMFTDSLPGETLSQALQRASAAVRESRANPHFAHPLFWAGFSIIGDGQALLVSE